LEADAYKRSPAVYVDWLVPPLVASRVPASVTAPPVAVLGVNPDRLVWNDVTPAAAADAQESVPVPLVDKNCPEPPSALGSVQVTLEPTTDGALNAT